MDTSPRADVATPVRREWEVQRLDTRWGGFRAMPTAFDDNEPARFAKKGDAIAATLLAAESMAPHHQFRAYNQTNGVIVSFTRRDGQLVVQSR